MGSANERWCNIVTPPPIGWAHAPNDTCVCKMFRVNCMESNDSPQYQQITFSTLRWRHNERDDVSNHQPHDCLLNRLFRRRSKKTPKLRVTGLCVGNSPVTGEFPAQRASNAENVSIWWRHRETPIVCWYRWEMYAVSIFSSKSALYAALFRCHVEFKIVLYWPVL